MFSIKFGNKEKGLVVRLAIKKDAGDFRALRKNIDAESPFMLASAEERQDTVKGIKKRFSGNDHGTFVAIDSGKLIGYININRGQWKKIKHTAHIALAVQSEHRGKGVGTKLLKKAEEWAEEIGIERLELEVLENNPAHRLYIKLGYTEEGRRHGVVRYENGDKDTILMAKKVAHSQ